MVKKFQKLRSTQTKILKGGIKRIVKRAIESKKERESQQSNELRQYLRKVGETPLINFEEESKLWRKIKEKKEIKS
jgi:hypothetical protein